MSPFEVEAERLDELLGPLASFEAGGTVPAGELFPPAFVAEHTDAPDVEAYVEASPFSGPFAEFPDDGWDEYVAETSAFDDWEAMQLAAALEWVEGQFPG